MRSYEVALSTASVAQFGGFGKEKTAALICAAETDVFYFSEETSRLFWKYFFAFEISIVMKDVNNERERETKQRNIPNPNDNSFPPVKNQSENENKIQDAM